MKSLPPCAWQAIDKSLWFTRLACRAEHGFADGERQELAAATIQQLDVCLSLGEVSCTARKHLLLHFD